MKLSFKKTFAFLGLLLCSQAIQSQISGTFSVPANYSTIAAAINALNTQGINGPVTILVNAGYTETVPNGGYTLTATGTAANPIVFMKNGSGANPIITAYSVPSTLTPSNTTQDGVWSFIGSDYITVDGIDINDPNTTNPATMEYGYGFFKANATNGCQNNVIKNCTISLNANNNDMGSGPATDGSRGIDVVNALKTAHTTSLIISSPSGSNSYNKFYSNVFKNCNTCISIVGYHGASPYANSDTGNEIGGTVSSNGNTFLNYGGGTGTSWGSPYVFPAMAVYTYAQYDLLVSNNFINNNNGLGLNHSGILKGIYVSTAMGANTTISSNTLAMNTGSVSYQINGIENESGSGSATSTVNILNNVISNGTSSNVALYNGIVNSAACGVLNLTGNTFTNNVINPPSLTSGNFIALISSSGAVSQIHNVNNNVLSYKNDTYFSNGTSLYAIGNVNAANTCTTTISGNLFTDFNFSFPINNGNVNFLGAVGNHSRILISNNSWNNLSLNNYGNYYFFSNSAIVQNQINVTNNIINGVNFTGGTPYGVSIFHRPVASGPVSTLPTYSNNLIANITCTTTGGSSGNLTFYSILEYEGSSTPFVLKTISSNTISNINITAPGDFYGFNVTRLGDGNTTSGSSINNNIFDNITFGGNIYCISTGTLGSPNYPAKIFSNRISNINSSGSSSSVYGAYLGCGGAGLNFYRNKIYNLSSNGTNGVVYGINTVTSTAISLNNNLIGNLTAPFSGNSNGVIGISTESNSNVSIDYNSVYLNASSSGPNFGSSALFSLTTSSVTLRNNIFINNSTATGSGLTVAYRRNAVSLTGFLNGSNNNLYYAGTPSTSKLIMHDGTNNYQTLATYKSAVAPRDGAAATENVNFVSTTGSSPSFLDINPSIPTLVESGAIAIASITTDYSGTTRNVSTPDIGAWEGNFVSTIDLTPPSIGSFGFSTPACIASGRTFTANLSDVSGVASGVVAPKIYYKINSNPYTNVSGVLSSGTSTNGVWTFNLTYAASVLDVVSWYLVAEDIAAPANVLGFPGAGLAATSVTNVTTPPTSPNTYTVVNLNGIYTVGSTGTFTSLTQAANIYNVACLSGPVTFSLIDASYSTNETFPITFINNPDASSTNSLLIIPAAGVTASVIGTSTSLATLKFEDARFITADGLNSGGSSLDITSLNTGTCAVIWLATTSTGNKNIGIQNSNINAASSNSVNFGILGSSDGSQPAAIAGADNDNISILNNTITSVFYGVYGQGSSSSSTGGIDNWNITGNNIGPVVSGVSDIGLQGIHIENALGLTVNSNTVQNISCVLTSTICGVVLGNGVSNAMVNLNKINSISYTGSGAWGCIGMDIDPGSSSANITVENNMISDVKGFGGFAYNAGSIVGLRVGVSGNAGNLNIRNNSIVLNQGNTILGNSSFFPHNSAAVYFGPSASNIDFRNNIVHSDVEFGIPMCQTHAVFFSAGSSAFTGIDYNNYSVAGSQGILAKMGGTLLTNLSMIQSSIGQNLNSSTITPVFTSVTDLHLNTASNFFLDNTATPLVSVLTDIDGQTRNLTTPDMGADEFTSLPCTSANSGIASPNITILCAGQTATLNTSGSSTGSGITYQWMVSSTPGGPYTNVSGGSGAATVNYVTASLPAASYYYILETTCSASSATAASNEVTVTVNAIPTSSASSNSPICSGTNLNLTGGTDIGTSFQWTSSNGFSSTLQNPGTTSASVSASGVYTFVATANGCSSAPVTTTVVINPSPTTLSVTPMSSIMCGTGNQTITVSGGLVSSALNFGTASSVNTNGTYPAPYNLAFGGQKMQMLVLASELSAAGFVANTPLNSLEFPVSSFGANWGSTTFNCQSFQVNLGLTALNSLPSFQTGLTNVLAPVNFTPTLGYNNAHYFSSPFLWDGVSNVIIETSFSNNNTGTPADAVVQYTTTNPGSTSFNSTVVYYANNTSASAMASISTVSGVFMARPDFKLNGHVVGTYNWSPSGTLSSSTGTNVVATPVTSTNYTVSVTDGVCTSSAVAVINVGFQPTVNITPVSPTICASSNVTLTASGATTYSWNTGATSTSVNVSPSANTTYTVTGFNGACVHTKTVSVSVNALPTVSLSALAGTVCVNDPTVTLTGSPSGGNYSGSNVASNVFTPPSTGGTFNPVYSYTNAVTGCSNTATTQIVVSPCTGIDEQTALSGVKVYPNPTNGIFNIEFAGYSERTIEITDVTGRLVIAEKITSDKIVINMENFSKGVYLLKIRDNGAVKAVKILNE